MSMEYSSQDKKEALQAGLPHLAYVLLWFPLFTQPFIFREIKCLERFLPLEVYTLYGKNSRFWSDEMREANFRINRYGIRSLFNIIYSTILNFCKNPALMWKLFGESCLWRWNSLEIFGENLWAFCVGADLAKRLKEDGIDLIYAPWPRGAATAARVASRLSGIPFMIAARGDNLNPADPDLELKFSDSLLIRTNNAADMQRIENFGEKKAHGKTCLVYNSLTLPPLAENEQSQKKSDDNNMLSLCAVGRFDVTKGFDDLLRACSILKKKGLKFRLTLVGGGGRVMGLGDLEKYLRNLRDELNLGDCVSMPGLVSHNELPNLLKTQDIFVAPCVIHKTGRRDGIPNTVIEAMACKLPVIGTNINALPEVIKDGETGLLVEEAQPGELARAIMKLADNPELARKMGENGSELARALFNCEKNARSLANLFIRAWRSHKREVADKCAE